MRCSVFYFLLTVCFTVLGVNAQTSPANESDWAKLKDDKVDISVSLPPNYLVDTEAVKSLGFGSFGTNPRTTKVSSIQKPTIYGSQKGCSMTLDVREFPKSSKAAKYLFYLVDQDAPKNTYQDFQIGDFIGRKTNSDTDKFFSINVLIAAENKIFSIYALAPKEDSRIYEKFVHSIMLNGKPLFKSSKAEPADSAPPLPISELKMSQEITDAVNRKTDASESKVIKNIDPPVPDSQATNSYSRPLIILRKPRADGAQENGTINLKVTFLANGKIGNIYILSGKPKTLINNAVKAAQQIKFLPAEIDGKKVDSLKTLVYSFSVSWSV